MLRSPRFDRNQLRVQRIGEPRYNFVLHIEEVGDRLVEALGPQVISSLGGDQLHIHPKPVTTTLHRTFKNVPDVQLAPDLLHVNGLALEGERRAVSDDERAADARQVRGQALGYTINEIILLGIATDVRKRQYHDGQTGG